MFFVNQPYEKFGLSVPRFCVNTKWAPPINQLIKASAEFPGLTFDIQWSVVNIPAKGEAVIINGTVEEERNSELKRQPRPVMSPMLDLLPTFLPCTLAQHGARTVEEAISVIQHFRWVLDELDRSDPNAAKCEAHRDRAKVDSIRQSLDRLLEQIKVTREEFVATSPVTITDRPDVEEGFGSEVESIA